MKVLKYKKSSTTNTINTTTIKSNNNNENKQIGNDIPRYNIAQNDIPQNHITQNHKTKKNQITALILLTILSLSGCGTKNDNMSLIQPPALTGKTEKEVQNVLNELLPPDSQYVTAKKSEPKQSIFMDDLNMDGIQEAVVLYQETKDNRQVHMLVMNQRGGNWSKLSDVTMDYTYLDYFNLSDLDGNESKEITIGLGFLEEPTKNLYIYNMDNENIVKKAETTYEWIDIADYDEDKNLDLFVLDGEVNQSQTAKLLNYKDNQLQSKTSIELDPYAYHENIVRGKLLDGKQAVFIDSGVGAHSMITEIIVYEKDKLIKVGNENDEILLKPYPLYSKDVNGDGVIEVGGMYIPKGYEDYAMVEIPFIYTYNDFSLDGTSQTIEQRYVDNNQHFYITIPKEWHQKVTIKKLKNGVSLIDHKEGNTLFEVKWAKKESYHEDEANTKFAETLNTIFYTDNKKEMAIPSENFHLIAEDFQ